VIIVTCVTECRPKPAILQVPCARSEATLAPMLGNGGCNMCGENCPSFLGNEYAQFCGRSGCGHERTMHRLSGDW